MLVFVVVVVVWRRVDSGYHHLSENPGQPVILASLLSVGLRMGVMVTVLETGFYFTQTRFLLFL